MDKITIPEWALILILLLCMVFGGFLGIKMSKPPHIKTEYHVELINKEVIKVYSVSTETLYLTSPDSLVSTLEKDNL